MCGINTNFEWPLLYGVLRHSVSKNRFIFVSPRRVRWTLLELSPISWSKVMGDIFLGGKNGSSVPSQEQLFRRLTLAWDHRYRLSPDLGGCKEHGISDLLIIFYRLARRWPRRKESRPYPTLGVFGFRPQILGVPGIFSWGCWVFTLISTSLWK